MNHTKEESLRAAKNEAKILILEVNQFQENQNPLFLEVINLKDIVRGG